MGLVTPAQFDEHGKAWRVVVKNGSVESLLTFICRERGVAEDLFLQKLARALNWPYLDLPKLEIPRRPATGFPPRWRSNIPSCPPTWWTATVQVAVSNPFDTAMLNAVRFDARGPVEFALATKAEIERPSRNTMALAPRRSMKWVRARRSRSSC